MRSFHRHALITVLFTALSGTASAATPAVTGLGEVWPNATDVSASPHFHVYAFQKQGVRYLQINDSNGTVRGAIALIGNEALELPVGVDASRWTITGGPAAPATGETVYRDTTTPVQATPQSDGTMRLMLAPTDCKSQPQECGNRGP